MKYTAPEMEMKALDVEDIMDTSPVGGGVVGDDGSVNTPEEEL